MYSYDKNGLQLLFKDGLLLDQSGNGNVITNNGATLTADHNGRANRGYLFDNVADNIIVGNALSLGFGTADFTICIGIKPSITLTTLQTIITCIVDANNYFAVYLRKQADTVTVIELRTVIDGTVYRKTVINSFVNDTYSFIGIVKNGSDNPIYTNGILQANSINGITNQTFGHNANVTIASPHVIELDHLSIYNRALSASEIQKLYNYWRTH